MKNLDLWIASLILASSLGIGVVTYEKISLIEAPQVKLLSDILKRGDNRFAIRSGKRCVGEIRFSIEGSESINVQGNSVLRISADKLISEANASFGVTFNPLQQFSGGEFKLGFSDTQLSVMAEGTNPIEISATWKGFGEEKTFRFPMQGPLLMKGDKDGAFHLEYPFKIPMTPLLQHPALISAKEKLDLRVERAEDPAKACEPDQLKRLKLDELIKILRSFIPQASQTP